VPAWNERCPSGRHGDIARLDRYGTNSACEIYIDVGKADILGLLAISIRGRQWAADLVHATFYPVAQVFAVFFYGPGEKLTRFPSGAAKCILLVGAKPTMGFAPEHLLLVRHDDGAVLCVSLPREIGAYPLSGSVSPWPGETCTGVPSF